MANQPKQVASPSTNKPAQAPKQASEAPVSAEAATAVSRAKAAPATGVEQIEAAKNATKSGNTVVLEGGEKRVDYIRRRIGEGASRGVVAKELGVPYQIVFAATKVKKEKPAAEAAAA